MFGFVRPDLRRLVNDGGRHRLGAPVAVLRAAGPVLVAIFLATLAAAVASASRAAETASAWYVTEQGRVRLVSGVDSIGPDATVPLGLDFDLKPGWKIYWRSPGDAGLPPELDWTGSENLQSAALGWPAPRRFAVQGLETVGYEGRVVLPITARLVHVGTALRLRAALHYLTCSNICVPHATHFVLDLAAGPGGPSADAALIARYVAREPRHEETPDLAIRSAQVIPGAHPALELYATATPRLHDPDVFVEGAGDVFGAPRVEVGPADSETILRIPVSLSGSTVDRLAGKKLRVTLVDDGRGLATTLVPMLGTAPPGWGFLARILGIALLGGFILNFMPCVLPVLSLKLLGIAGGGGQARGRLRLGLIASAAGVVASFLALAGIMIALRAAGVAVGWGMQFQQPLFLIFMMALVTLFAANLWGLFQVPLPGALADWGGAGQGQGVLGNFLTGAFVTLLATPCSAPFLGTAVGFALAAGGTETLLIFVAMGMGLALPYLAIAAMPRLVGWLPRPGHWMVVLRRVLGVALAATAIWLAWILAAESGPVAAAAALVLIAAMPAVLYLLRGIEARAAVVAALLALAFLIPAALPAPPPAAAAADDGIWQPFDPAAITGLVNQGRTVFVDVTADWCLTCKLNERLAIDTPAVKRRLAAAGVVAMRADWTRPSPRIARYLEGFGRYGIPFNAVYGPALPQGRALPELLTPDEVVSALEHSRKGG
jgi:suppressor for copper-sensitivity B